MKTSRITSYSPLLSVEENAANNNVSVAAIRYYIKTHGIDRTTDKQIAMYSEIEEYHQNNPQLKASQIAKALGYAESTVRKYLRMSEPPKPRAKKVSAVRQVEKVHFMSVSESQSDILKSILAIHLSGRDRYDCDLTAWKCGFYRDGLLRPYWLYDKYPQIDDVKNLEDIDNDSIYGALKSVVIDLPTTVQMPSTKKINIEMAFSSMDELYAEHKKMLNLAYRLLRSDGVLVYKTMDFTYQNTPMWISDYVLREAINQGFELADKYIYIDSKHTKIDRRRTRYTASVPAHAYFFVFRKSRKG